MCCRTWKRLLLLLQFCRQPKCFTAMIKVVIIISTTFFQIYIFHLIMKCDVNLIQQYIIKKQFTSKKKKIFGTAHVKICKFISNTNA